jgi:hypothetical protein
MSVIKLVQNDNLPEVTLTLTDKTSGDPLDLSASTTTAVVKLRASGTTTVLHVLPCSKTNGGADGVIKFGFPANTLDVDEGTYEGEIEISFNGVIQTVFDVLRFYVRAEF